MTTKTRRSFTDEFKPDTVALLASSGRPSGRVARVMRRHGVQAKWRRAYRPCPTDSNHTLPEAPSLLDRQVSPDAPGRAPTKALGSPICLTSQPPRGWLCLAVVLDLFASIEGTYTRWRLHSALGSITEEQAAFRAA
ncbi:transposase [Roseospira navarrensis]|uniref:Transposase n=1 Tax=Roseospira navarrensis TaxID=140058 RepID=A0A7X2D2G5_9PROT|nr:transposase [Roseospira navarrensis]MQX35676.1 transposase [Roseospira navarrensis]